MYKKVIVSLITFCIFCSGSFAGNPNSDARLREIANEQIDSRVPPMITNNPGSQGPQGPQGPAGAQGPAGGSLGCTGANLGECKVFITTATFDGALDTANTFIQNTCGSVSDAIDKANCICSVEGAHISAGRWRAWLSTLTTDAADNINYNSGATYIRASDNTVIAGPGILLSGTLAASVSASANYIHTGTDTDGTNVGTNCSNWTSVASTSRVGQADATDGNWTNNQAASCASIFPRSIYCFEAPSS